MNALAQQGLVSGTEKASAQQSKQNMSALPVIRDELLIHVGPRLPDGSPSWTLEDPVRNLFFRLGAAEVMMLKQWHLGETKKIINAVNQCSTLTLDDKEVSSFAQFLQQQHLVRVEGSVAHKKLLEYAGKSRSTWYQQVLKNYLFFRIPLWRPDTFLTQTLSFVRHWILNRWFLFITAFIGFIALMLVIRQWDVFIHSFSYFFTLEGAAVAGLTLALTKVVHEFGHAYMCKHFGCRVSTMGMALMVLFPVLYTDTSGAWRLPSKKARLLIGGAGMMAETMLAAWATLLWHFLPDGMLRSAMFILATTTWILTIAVNLNPLMRFDGYFLLSDLLNIPNLQTRAFAFARWRLREWFFGFGEKPPEKFDAVRRRIVLVYAYAVWVYRFFLFIGIAILVYHFTFKLLGIVLFAVEMGVFVIRPIVMECAEWIKRRASWRWNKHTRLFAGALILLLLVLIFPWHTTVRAPAMLHSGQQMQIYAPDTGGQLVQLTFNVGDTVKKDQLLSVFSYPDKAKELETIKRRLDVLQWQSAFHTLSKDTLEQTPIALSELNAVQERYRVLQRQAMQMEIKSTLDGVVTDMVVPLAQNEWIAPGEWIATIVKPNSNIVEGYVVENDVDRISVGDEAWFYPKDITQSSRKMRVEYVSHVATNDLSNVPELASVYGGRIAAIKDGQKLKPEQAIYLIRCKIDDKDEASAFVPQQGNIIVEGAANSWLISIIKKVMVIFIRESSF